MMTLNTPESGAIIAIGSAVVNFVWSSLNLRLLRSMEIRFVTKEQFTAAQRLHHAQHIALGERMDATERLRCEQADACRSMCDVKFAAMCQRLEKAGA